MRPPEDPGRATARLGGGAFSGAPTGRTPPQRRRPGVSGSEHKRASSPPGTPDPGRVARMAVQAGGASSGTEPPGGVQPPMRRGKGRRAEIAAAVTEAKTRARALPSARWQPVLRGERLPRRGKSEPRGGVGEAPYLPSAKHGGMGCGAVAADEHLPSGSAGNASERPSDDCSARVSDPAETADRKVSQGGVSAFWARTRANDDVANIGVGAGDGKRDTGKSECNRWACLAGMWGRSGGVRNLVDQPGSATAGRGSS
jgi:hypothetical protein